MILTLPPGIENASKKLFGVQFHPEVDLSENGVAMMKNFLFKVSCAYQQEIINCASWLHVMP